MGDAAGNTYYAGEGDDIVDGGIGSDNLWGQEGRDYLYGGAGDDNLYGEDGNDILDGGTGNDLLNGGTGNDAYIFGLGSGQDSVFDADGADVIKVGAGVAPANVRVWRDLSNLYIGIDGTADVLTVQCWFDSPSNRVESVQFADGTVWDTAALAAAKFTGTEGADYLTGSTGNDLLEGRGGDDSLAADAGNDTLDGGTGNDNLDGGAGNDTFVFGLGYGQDTVTDADGTDAIKLGAGLTTANVRLWRDTSNLYVGTTTGSDVLTVQGWFDLTANRVESMHFADGTVWNTATLAAAVFGGTPDADSISGTVGNDTIYGFGGDDYLTGDAGNDVLDGGTGNDALDGGAGNDTFVFGLGYGQDSVTDVSGTDVIKLGAGLTTTNVQLWRDASSLYVGIAGTADVLTVQGWFDLPTNRVESIQFADGTVWNAAALAAAKYAGTEGADDLTGSTGNDLLEGRGGDDALTADAGDDTLDGGTGNDNLDGGAGNDTFVFGLGFGQDMVTDVSGTDVIKLGAGLTTANVRVWRDTSNLYVGTTTGSDVFTVQGWFDLTTNRVESVQFADGTVWNTATLAAAAFGGTSGADSIFATTGNDTLLGFGGNDALHGDAGNDTLDGGTGNDMLDGGTGNDTYKFGRGHGQDRVSETSGTADAILFDANTAPADVLVSRDASHLYLSIAGTQDKLTIQNWYVDPSYQVEQLKFADGAIWTVANLNAIMTTASAGADFYWGSTGNDTFNGLAGNDQLMGNGGNDTLSGGAGNDLLDGGTGNDTLTGGTGDDIYVVDSTADVVAELAGEGSDTVRSSIAYTLGANVEKLELLEAGGAINGTGNTLANTLSGNTANNTLNGGAGADTLVGGVGNDTYVVDDVADAVTENLNEGTDLVQSNLNWTLGANLENLTLTGTTAINGTGNELNNVLTGNAAANVLTGGAGNDNLTGAAGNDTLDGGAGSDTLAGGTGNDTYLFGSGSGADVINENDATSGNTDVLAIGGGVSISQLWFRRVGTNLEVSIIGSTDKTTINNWYAGSAYHIEQFRTSDGKTLLDSQVDALVSAMAAFAPPAAGQTTLPPAYQTALNPVISANWQ